AQDGTRGLRRHDQEGMSTAPSRGRAGRLRARPRGLCAEPRGSRGGRAHLQVPRGAGPARRPEGRGATRMKYLDEYRDGRVASKVLSEIRRLVTRPWTLMEVCGGQTHSIVKHGVDRLLPAEIELVHGPGCPVCVTPLEQIDKAHAIARLPGVVFTSFGDMLRVPGTATDLLRLKSEGADVRIVYAPLDAVRLAQEHPDREVVFFGVGFETTAPANALAVTRARALGVRNFSMLVSQVLVPPAITAVLQSPGNRVQGFLGPGHVCTVMGYREYEPIARHYRVPVVVTGFEPLDLLDGVLRAVRLLEAGRAVVENQYSRVVGRDGNRAARE